MARSRSVSGKGGNVDSIIIIALIVLVIVLTIYSLRLHIQLNQRIKFARAEAIGQSRATLGGLFTEQLSPYLPEFRYDPTDARFLGSPIDLIVFRGLSSDTPEEIVFIEVKTGKNAKLTKRERRVRELVEERKVRWELIHRNTY
ncbi:MAG: Holliday junction resolvase [SAR202 cluster bacterium]|nr:Holliday junction resolvase [SAR202 cluster bacterium]